MVLAFFFFFLSFVQFNSVPFSAGDSRQRKDRIGAAPSALYQGKRTQYQSNLPYNVARSQMVTPRTRPWTSRHSGRSGGDVLAKMSWNRFKNPELQTDRLVAFASHDSCGYTGIDSHTPIWIPQTSRVGLSPLDSPLGWDEIFVGLLFTREEFNALILLRFPDHRFSDSFLDSIFDITSGLKIYLL